MKTDERHGANGSPFTEIQHRKKTGSDGSAARWVERTNGLVEGQGYGHRLSDGS